MLLYGIVRGKLQRVSMQCSCSAAEYRQLNLLRWAEKYREAAAEGVWHLARQLSDDNYTDLDSWLIARKRDRRISQQFDDGFRFRASSAIIRERTDSWNKMRDAVYERDSGICDACRRRCSFGNFDLGHLVDRVAGGIDCYCNLVVHCRPCNQMKPVHETLEEYAVWKKQDGVVGDIIRFMSAELNNG